ncbi:FtsX-like permease family protein [Luteipulveratus halotolerans]|uniref:FtsX-like permease family protein n=1 Tax=Luteipulveratus halotolerans TaxID=1631356 RepID=UPI00068197A3|nr:FtsX-like permease family protein [Luteipulveratus halotolerans]
MSSLRTGSVLRIAAVGGRADRLRMILTAVGAAAATVALLLAAAVASIGPVHEPYKLKLIAEPGLRPGAMSALLLLCLPVLGFAGQCSRIGAPARDRRLAALRMAGATPSEVRRVVAWETGLAAAAGVLLGGAVYAVAHIWFSEAPAGARPTMTEVAGSGPTQSETVVGWTDGLLFPTDVVPHWWLLVLIGVVVPLGAALGARLALRRTALTPFAVTRRVRRRPPALLPALMFLGAGAGLVLWSAIGRALPASTANATWYLLMIPLLVLIAAVGLMLGTASCAYALGRLIAPRTGRPALLIAARRMVDAPFTASRVSTSVILAVLLGCGAYALRENFTLARGEVGPYRDLYDQDRFFTRSFEAVNAIVLVGLVIAVAGLLVVAAEGVVTRRRTLAAMTAAGVPRRTLATAIVLETLVPLVPAVLVAGTTGVLAARGLFGRTVETNGPVQADGSSAWVTLDVPVPWASSAGLIGAALVLALLMTTGSLLFLRSSTDIRELRAAA